MKVHKNILSYEYYESGIYLFLGATDIGKTTLISSIASKISGKKSIAIVDADTGQSHIGPPTTVGWAIARQGENDLSKLPVEGIAFTGYLNPIGHMLQLARAIIKCVENASKKAETVLIDTPGFVTGPAACVFWWEIVTILKPKAIIVINRENELFEIIKGLKNPGCYIEMIRSASKVKQKSAEQRTAYRQKRFEEYFARSKVYKINLKNIAIQTTKILNMDKANGLLLGLRNFEGDDISIGALIEWRQDDKIILKSPVINPKDVCCIIVGDTAIDLPV